MASKMDGHAVVFFIFPEVNIRVTSVSVILLLPLCFIRTNSLYIFVQYILFNYSVRFCHAQNGIVQGNLMFIYFHAHDGFIGGI